MYTSSFQISNAAPADYPKHYFSPRAFLAGIGQKLRQLQSVVQKTLDACTQENVQQMEQALDEIYCAFSQGAQHNYEQALQILDVDMSGQPCGPKAAFATKGYFAIRRSLALRDRSETVADDN